MTEEAAILTESDHGKTVDARVGDTIVLRLPENATTGYRWAFDDLDTAIVNAQEGEHAQGSGAVGGGGEMTWRLTTAAPGSAHVKLKLWRQWEGDSSVKKRFAFTVSVKP